MVPLFVNDIRFILANLATNGFFKIFFSINFEQNTHTKCFQTDRAINHKIYFFFNIGANITHNIISTDVIYTGN